MGLIIYRKVTNILEVPADVLVNFIGLGLKVRRMSVAASNESLALSVGEDSESDRQEEPAIKIDVDLGDGLKFTESGDIVFDVGDGLLVDNDKLLAKIGKFLQFDGNGNIVVNVGDGLKEDESGHLTLDHEFICKHIEVDNTPSPDHSQEIMVQTGSKLSLEGNLLSLDKTYQKYTIVRNKYGRILDMVVGEVVSEKDEVSISSGYGYGGYGTKPALTKRSGSLNVPNFYTK